MRVDILPTAGAVGEAAADDVLRAIGAARAAGRRALVGWPVGRTPRPVVAALVDRARAGRLDLHDVVFVLMDDYIEPVDPPGTGPGAGPETGPGTEAPTVWRRIPTSAGHSCRGSAEREIVAPLAAALAPECRLDPEALWSPDPEAPEELETRVADAGGIDLFLVALGTSDGHVALNAPGSGRYSRTRVVRLPVSTRRDNLGTFASLRDLDDVPSHGVTVGLATISAAHRLCVLAHGPDKRPVASRLVAATGFDARWPMTVVVDHPQARLVLDVAAAPAPAPAPAPGGAPTNPGPGRESITHSTAEVDA